jgi:predicted hotdog family 3-hydroxylacyl-ACP dehydratase
MNMKTESIPTSELEGYLPHRPPMVWVDEVLSYGNEGKGPFGVCRVSLGEDRPFHGADGKVRVSAAVEWIAQSYGYVKASIRRAEGGGTEGFGRAFLVGITDCDVDLSSLGNEKFVHVHVKELRDMHPAYVVEGKITSEDGIRQYGQARIKVFGGEIPAA